MIQKTMCTVMLERVFIDVERYCVLLIIYLYYKNGDLRIDEVSISQIADLMKTKISQYSVKDLIYVCN